MGKNKKKQRHRQLRNQQGYYIIYTGMTHSSKSSLKKGGAVFVVSPKTTSKMSSLQKSAMSARIALLPPMPPPPSDGWDDTNEDDEGDEIDGLGALPSAIPSKRAPRRTNNNRNQPDLSQYASISAADYFTQALQINVPQSSLDFRIYYTPSASSSSSEEKAEEGPATVLVCHHGAGYSALSFAAFAAEVKRLSKGELGVLALDARNHGKTTNSKESAPPSADHASDSGDVDLSIDTLTSDLTNLLTTVFPDPKLAPSFLLVGHSMGGAVMVRTCPQLLEQEYRVAGVVVLDVVEGSALEALPHMHTLLASRPAGFDSIEKAVEWHLSNHTIRNTTSARISIPSLFVPNIDPTQGPPYKWRAPLHLTAPFWSGWFTDLSNLFLACRTARLLILAGTDRLDKTLMIGQMQGKFQMEVVPNVGHMLHEDDPIRLAETLVDFWKRNERVMPGLIGLKLKKVGEQ